MNLQTDRQTVCSTIGSCCVCVPTYPLAPEADMQGEGGGADGVCVLEVVQECPPTQHSQEQVPLVGVES